MLTTMPLEICVDSADSLTAAITGGADRIELCSALALGGLTPSAGLMAYAAAASAPCHAMIRPRDGDFCLRWGDLDAMLGDISAVKQAGLAGIVIGVSHEDGSLDRDALARLVEAAGGLKITLHRVIDLTPDPFSALDIAIELGINRVLSSGQQSAAPTGAKMLADLVSHAAGRIEIMAGGGVTKDTALQLIATGVDALHSSCRVRDPLNYPSQRIGIAPRDVTDAATVAALKTIMTQRTVQA